MSDSPQLDPSLTVCPNCGAEVDPDYLIPAGSIHVCPHCRDAFQQRIQEGVPALESSEWVAIREAHISHESSLRSLGLLLYLGAFFMLFSVFSMSITLRDFPEGRAIFGTMITIYSILAILSIIVGRGYRKLRAWVKVPGAILSGIGLLGFPIFTIINGYILYLLFSSKGSMVLSAEYKEIIAATPGVKCRTSPAAWAVLAIAILCIVAIIVAAL
ncbi:hypothetical protein [Coraliomargarita parva]|uniref:hypothetical protein n=1 Tax=Coraliomargarita parva TaxID=3014050 RepID=UPI0022B4B612|nr:hypothetical protein [Coraliomargarita parva]